MAGSATSVLRPRGAYIVAPHRHRSPGGRGQPDGAIASATRFGNAAAVAFCSSIPGGAIIEVEIDGVLHEYTTLEGTE